MSAVMLLRNSERSTFKTCRHRWEWTYLGQRQSIDTPRALRFGDLFHRSLDAYYRPGRKRGPKPAGTFEKLYHEQAEKLSDEGFNVFSDDKWVDALPLGIGMLEGWVARFAEEDKEWEVVASEMTFQLPITTPNGFKFKIVGTFDGVWRNRSSGRIEFREWKTAAAIKLDGLPMDDQAGVYWTYGPKFLKKKGILKEDEMPSAIGYRFARKAIPNPDKVRNAEGHVLNKDGSVSKQQPAPYFSPTVPVYRDETDRLRIHNRVCHEAEMIARARGVLPGSEPLIKNPGPLHMPNCMGCAVREACELHETGGDWESMLDMTMTAWNPYAAHELPERH